MSVTKRPSPRWDGEVDVVVVGFGAAGACGALEAAQNGTRVAVLDRFHGGGATAASGAVIYAGGGTPYQRAAGFDDTPQEMHDYLKLEAGDVVSDVTLRRFCDQSAANIAWLEEAGVPFEASLSPFKTSYPTDDYCLYFSGNEQALPYRAKAKPAPRGHRTKGSGISGLALFQALRESVRDQGILVRTQTEVQRLVSSQTGKIVGVEGRSIPADSRWAAIHSRLSRANAKATTYAPPIARHIAVLMERIMDRHGEPFSLRARAGVILASGGFVFNPEMVARHAPLYQRCLPLGTAGDDGSGIRMGESVGGATARMDRMSAWVFYVPPEVLSQGVLVSKKGERIGNEELYGATLGDLIAASGGEAYLVFDSDTYRHARRSLWGQAAPFQLLYMVPTLLLRRKKARSLAAMADKLGVPVTGLQATMAAYNTAAARGEPDPQGKSQKYLIPQDRPPYYAIDCSLDWTRGVPCATMSLGGLVVDEETGLVLRSDGSPIDGLYAAGRNAVGVCSESYVSGLSVADCVFSGRRAGRHIALMAGCHEDPETAPSHRQRPDLSLSA